MAGIRQEKMAELIRRDLSVIFQREANTWFGGMFISVTQVRMAPDLGLAKVYLSFHGGARQKDCPRSSSPRGMAGAEDIGGDHRQTSARHSRVEFLLRR